MSIFQKLLKLGQPEQTKGGDINFGWRELDIGGFGLSNKISQLDQYRGWVYRCVKVLSQEFATIELELYKGDKFVEQNKGEPWATLNKPNPINTFYTLLFATQAYKELTGKCYWYLPLNGAKKPAEIWILRPDLVKVVNSGDISNPVKEYQYFVNGKKITFDPQEIIPFHDFNPKSLLGGYGTVDASAETIDTENEIKKWNNRFFKNSARPDIVFEYDGIMGQSKADEIIDKWERKHKGSENAHKPALLQGGLKMHKWNFSQKEMDFIEQRRFSRDEIFTLFGVPKAILTTEDINLANSKTALWHFLRFTVKPKMVELVDALNEHYLNRYWSGEGYEFKFLDPVPQDRLAEVAEYSQSVNRWLTVNEIREMEGYEPVENGDVIYTPMGQTPLGTAPARQYPDVEPEPEPEPDTDDEPEKGAKGNKLEKDFGAILDMEKFEETGERIYKDVMKRTESVEEFIKRSMAEEFDRQANEAIMNLTAEKAGGGAQTKLAVRSLINKEIALASIIGFLTEAEMENIMRNGQEAMAFVGTEQLFDLESDRVKGFIANNVELASKKVLNTTYHYLRQEISEGEKLGEDITAISNRVRGLFDDMSFYRAERIARSETMRSANFGLEEGWRQSKVVIGKRWWTALDERVCPMCEPLHGTAVGLGGTFIGLGATQEGSDGQEYYNDYAPVKYGNRHTNCRCVLVPIMEGEEKFLVEQERKHEMKTEVDRQVRKAKEEIERKMNKTLDEAINEI